MADGIRGHDYEQFPIDVQKGILLHRAIDTFTDAHPIFRKSKHRLHEAYGHYSGVIIDILYDHFLAKNWSAYSEEKLEDYANKFYQSLRENYDWLTARTQGMMPSMIGRNWLMSYSTLEGISMILFQMDYRTKNRANMQNAMKELQEFYTDFETEFTAFFEELRAHAQQKLAIL